MKIFYYSVCLCFVLSLSLTTGVGAFQDFNFEEVKVLAEKGDPKAQTAVGVAYSTGVSVEIDKKKAAEWYGKAADQSFPLGQWNLAFLYVRGEGVEQDDKKARMLFNQAAEQGFAAAEYDLGMMHLYGMGGKRSRTEALKWVRKAAAQGYEEAIGFLRDQGEYDKDQKVKKTPSQHLQ